MFKKWVLDASAGCNGVRYFCPYDDETGRVLMGFAVASDKPPFGGQFFGVFHPDGDDAVEKFCEENKDEIDRIVAAAR